MNENVKGIKSDAEWYCKKKPEADKYYRIFFEMCRKYNVSWGKASEQEKYFVEEVTRIRYERDRARRLGLPLSSVRLAFEPTNK